MPDRSRIVQESHEQMFCFLEDNSGQTVMLREQRSPTSYPMKNPQPKYYGAIPPKSLLNRSKKS